MERSMLAKVGVLGVFIALYAFARHREESPPAPPTPSPTPTAPASGKKLTTVSELKKEDLKIGTGKAAKTGDHVTVNYVGTLTDGTMFDQSYGREPFPFDLGAGGVIKGWDQGVVGMKEGGKRRLTVPGNMAYGERGSGDTIPPNATLVFEIELLKVG